MIHSVLPLMRGHRSQAEKLSISLNSGMLLSLHSTDHRVMTSQGSILGFRKAYIKCRRAPSHHTQAQSAQHMA